MAREFIAISLEWRPNQLSLSRPENILRSINTINEKLRGTKRLDLFECARVDPRVPVEESIAALAELKRQGKLDHIGISECSAETLRRGHKAGIFGLRPSRWLLNHSSF